MNKEQFQLALYDAVRGLPIDDVERSIAYYREMIDERIEDGMSEEDAVAAMGNVDEIAEQIAAEASAARRVAEPFPKERKKFPAWVPLLVIFCGIWLLITRFDQFGFLFGKATQQTFPVAGSCSEIRVETHSSDVRFVRSDDREARVEAPSAATVEVSGGVLTIRYEQQSGSNWFGDSDTDVTVFLTEDAYERLSAATTSGDIEVPAGFTFAGTALSTVSGDIDFDAQSDDLNVSTVSGKASINGVRARRAEISSTSGDIDLRDLSAEDSLTLRTVSGELDLERCGAGTLSAETTSGSVDLDRCDADALSIRTISGDVEGSLLSEKDFDVHTNSGSVSLPGSVSGAGRCEIHTTSGDVDLRIAS